MNQPFEVDYNPEVLNDIQKAVDFFRQKTGNDDVGQKFILVVKNALASLSTTALHYQTRYDDVRLLLIKPFSFAAHYRVNLKTKTVTVEAIIHTSQNPKDWKDRV